ncbi:MAG: sel1 repeat family protein [Nitrospinae bacterium]|nr:sel1 repeat family protein [Nitrospinota bacterium]
MSVTKRIIIPAFIFLLVFSIVSRVFFRDFQNGWEAYQNKDYKTASKLWLPLAEKGDTRAQFFLGFMNDMGFGVAENDKEAVKWYRLAAEQGNSRAQLFLGFMYDLGSGIQEDNREAAKWYKLAAEKGYEKAKTEIYNLAKENVPEALEVLIGDAENGVIEAQKSR